MRTDDTTSASTASEIVTIRSTRGVSHEKFFVDSQARVPDAAPTAAAAHIEHIATKRTPTGWPVDQREPTCVFV
jgi:hypothetical protein